MDREPVEPKKEMDFEKSILKSKELYELIDQEVHREHNLISNRMTWYVTSQSFLMAAFAVSGSSNHKFEWLSKPFLPVLGILTSLDSGKFSRGVSGEKKIGHPIPKSAVMSETG
jgi:hypothetical protein